MRLLNGLNSPPCSPLPKHQQLAFTRHSPQITAKMDLARRLAIDEIREKRRRCENIGKYVRTRISDQELREVLLKAAEDHNERGDITDMEFIFRFVPHEYESLAVSDEEASDAMYEAIQDAVHDRFRDQEGVTSYETDWTDDGIRRILICWFKQKPDVPDYLKDLPNIELQEDDCDIEDIQPDVGSESEETRSKFYPSLAPSLQHLQGCRGYGSVGFLGFLKNSNQSDRVIVTVRHLLDKETVEDAFVLEPEADTHLAMPQANQTAQRRLHVINHFQRRNHERPHFRWHWPQPRKCMDEICFVQTEGLSDTELNRFRFSQQIRCNALFPVPKGVNHNDAASYAALLARKVVVEKLQSMVPFTVHKQGAKTGHTTGTVVRLKKDTKGYGQKSEIKMEPDDVPAFYLVIKWSSHDQPFADGGDSGSLVYAEHEDKMVPLGIHFGSKEDQSYAWLVWSWCEEVYQWLNVELVFDLRVREDVS